MHLPAARPSPTRSADPTDRLPAPPVLSLRSAAAVVLLLALILTSAAGAAPSGLAAQESWRTDFTRHTVPLEEIVSGGPPKDGIPAIDDPRFVAVAKADRWLDDDEPVAVVRRGGAVKAYPLQILIWHEIVNDRVGGEPISVTYCPLCNTTLAFERRFDGRVLDFGTTGRLRHSDLVMYDRQTESWWQQATGEGIVGRYAGEELTFVPAPVMRWGDVREQLPEARVLSQNTGHPAYLVRYGTNPYEGYDRRSGPIASLFQGRRDASLPPMERVVALHREDESWAVPFRTLREETVAHLEVGGEPVVVFFQPATVSALDRRRIPDGRAVGSSAVYAATVDGRTLRFEALPGARYRDRETRSLWNLAGEAVEGPLEGRRLEEVAHGNHFWFAWAVFRPDTRIWEP
jgi:hypothetical protein